MKRNWLEWFSFVVLWMIIGNAYTWGTQIHIRMFIQQAGAGITWQNESIVAYLLSNYQFLEGSLFGFFFGNLFYFIHRLTDKYRLHAWPFWWVVGIKSLSYLIGLGFIAILMFFILTSLPFFPVTAEQFRLIDIPEFREFVFYTLLTMAFFMVLHNFYIQLGKNFGEGKVWHILLGYYRKPRVENKIFLFIDLKSSTHYAEELGHLLYSKLIQDCFRDLNSVAKKYRAEIYQYVGDEAVLTWTPQEGLHKAACIKMFFAFLDRIDHKKERYQVRYGLVPEFKAGGNMGEVTVAEVGHFKREIAYHGDVVNTASRLQGLCNEIGQKLVISDVLAESLSHHENYRLVKLSEVHLKGKEKPTCVYGVQKNGTGLPVRSGSAKW